jgi:hypothetical protein
MKLSLPSAGSASSRYDRTTFPPARNSEDGDPHATARMERETGEEDREEGRQDERGGGGGTEGERVRQHKEPLDFREGAYVGWR